jgi:hypothetical protein
MSGVRMESESDSVPETAEALDGYVTPKDMSDTEDQLAMSG